MANCAKGLACTGAAIILALGLAGIAISIYLFVGNQDWSQVIGNYQLSFAILFIVISCLITLTGAFGIFGVCYDSKCLLHLFWILLTIWMLGFIAAGVVAIILPSKVLAGGCVGTFSTFNDLDSKFTAAESTLCKFGCQCYIANTTHALTYIPFASSIDNTKAKNTMGCPGWIPSNTDSMFAGIEKVFHCSGWCNNVTKPAYYFTNNDDAANYPNDTCFNAFSAWFGKYGQYVYIASFVFAGISLILIACTWAYICQVAEHSK